MIPTDNWLAVRIEDDERDFPADPAKPSTAADDPVIKRGLDTAIGREGGRRAE